MFIFEIISKLSDNYFIFGSSIYINIFKSTPGWKEKQKVEDTNKNSPLMRKPTKKKHGQTCVGYLTSLYISVKHGLFRINLE